MVQALPDTPIFFAGVTDPVGADLVASLGLDVKKVAVECNRAIVPRSMLADVALAEGDALEIVHFVGGGC